MFYLNAQLIISNNLIEIKMYYFYSKLTIFILV